MGYAMPMDEINRNVLQMIKASDVGKMLSSADMVLLETELETVPAQRVGGWLGEQIAKAARQQLAKGDFSGHPFRGNQWSDSSGAGAGGGRSLASGATTGRRGRDQGDSLSVNSANQALAIRGERGVLFDGLSNALIANFANDEKAMKLLVRADEYGIETKAGKDALRDLVEHLENENQHTFAEAAARVLNPRLVSSEEAATSQVLRDADELRTFIDEQEGLLEVMELNGETDERLSNQLKVIAGAKRSLQAKISNQKDTFAAAEAMVASIYKDQMGSAEQSMIDDQEGIANLARASKFAIHEAQSKADQDESYGGIDEDLQVKAVAIKRAEERVMQLGMDVRTQLSQVVTSLKAINKRIDDKGISEAAQNMVNQTLKGYKAPLESLRKKLRDAGTREQQAAKIGLGSSGASMRLAMMQSATSNAIEKINDLLDQAENAGTDAEELSREMGNDY